MKHALVMNLPKGQKLKLDVSTLGATDIRNCNISHFSIRVWKYYDVKIKQK